MIEKPILSFVVHAVQNGVVVRDNTSPAQIGAEFVFVDQQTFGKWMEQWMHDVFTPIIKSGE